MAEGKSKREKARMIVDDTFKRELLYERRIRVRYNEEAELGIALKRDANGSWYRTGI